MLSALAAALMAGTASAAPAQPATLAGHRLPFPEVLDVPWVGTWFSFRQGVGYLSVPDVELAGDGRRFDLQLVGAAESVSFGAHLWGPVGWTGELRGRVTAGVNAESAFFEGARAGLSWETGPVVSVIRREQEGWQVGLKGLLRGQHGAVVEPVGVVAAALADPEATLRDVVDRDYARYLLTGERSLTGGAALAGAVVPWRPLGLLSSLRLRGGRATRTFYDGRAEVEDEVPLVVATAGLAVDLDARPVAPVSAQVEYRYRLELAGEGAHDALEEQSTHRHFGGAGAYYNGRDDLQLGAVTSRLLQRRGTSEETLLTVEFVIVYIF